MQTMTLVGSFDAAHRVMNEKVKCFNLHGHRFKVEMTFRIEEIKKLGYAMDFKEVKRIAMGFIDGFFDHASLFNPMDQDLIGLCEKYDWKLWVMGLGITQDDIDINPSAENIGSELFYILQRLFKDNKEVTLVNVRLYETPNCWVDTTEARYGATDFVSRNIDKWRERKGNVSYDIRENNG